MTSSFDKDIIFEDEEEPTIAPEKNNKHATKTYKNFDNFCECALSKRKRDFNDDVFLPSSTSSQEAPLRCPNLFPSSSSSSFMDPKCVVYGRRGSRSAAFDALIKREALLVFSVIVNDDVVLLL